MNENEQHHSRWIVAATCSALVLFVTTGGVLALRDQLLVQSQETAKAEKVEREKLASRISNMQSAIDALNAAPRTDGAALESINTQFSEMTAKFEALNIHVEALEKDLANFKPVAVPAPIAFAPAPPLAISPPPAQETHTELTTLKLVALSGKPYAAELNAWVKLHPESESTIAPLTEFAATGIISEAELARDLLEALEMKPTAAKIDDTSTIGKINTHLKGLVSIKKSTGDDPYAQLRKDALREDGETLARHVARLSDTDRAPLERWLKLANDRIMARDTLSKLMPEAER